MNTTNVTRFKSLRLIRYLEIALYASAAVLLIGRIFTLPGLLTMRDSLLVLLGETLGFMASCAASPLTAATAPTAPRPLAPLAGAAPPDSIQQSKRSGLRTSARSPPPPDVSNGGPSFAELVSDKMPHASRRKTGNHTVPPLVYARVLART